VEKTRCFTRGAELQKVMDELTALNEKLASLRLGEIGEDDVQKG